MKRKARILVVDDEPRYVWTIRVNLEARGYEVLVAHDGQEALSTVISQEPDLIILDVKMPEVDGYEVCGRIRQFSAVPIIMLTALAQEADLIKGLSLGADDYVTKPFSIEVLMARVRAALRRSMLAEQGGHGSIYENGELRIDFERERVWVGEREVSLTPLEYRLLYELVQQAGRILVPEYLLEHVWGEAYVGDNALLRQVIYRLRHKIERDPSDPQYIQTRLGSGYVFIDSE
jgi:two-component system KDP operon response regulator KdpE